MAERHEIDETVAGDPRGVVRRVLAFLVERFPPPPQLVLMVVLFTAATLMSGVLIAPLLDVELGGVQPMAAAAGFLGSLLFIVHLRLNDDVKDADVDHVDNPTRPIPRGLVTVRELDLTALIVLLIEGALMWSVGSLTFWCWGIAAGWSLLMRAEFFAPSFLDSHVATFAISHMVVMGLIYGQLLAIGIDARGGDISLGVLYAEPTTLLALAAATSIGIGFEWGRKFERYFAVHGERAWTWWMLWPSLGAMAFTWLARDAYPTWTLLALVTATLFTIVLHALVMSQRDRSGAPPTGPLRTVVEAAPGLSGLLVYLALATGGVVELIA